MVKLTLSLFFLSSVCSISLLMVVVLCSSQSSSVYVSDKLHITYSKSSGPGGQNVNMVNTKVDLRFHVASAEWISQDIREKILEQVRPITRHCTIQDVSIPVLSLWCPHHFSEGSMLDFRTPPGSHHSQHYSVLGAVDLSCRCVPISEMGSFMTLH